MLTIRLQRSGKRNKPEFRIVLAQKTAAAGKKFLEVLGNYNPRTKAFGVKSEDRLKYWIAQHVELSPTVHNLLVTKNFVSEKKVRAFSVPKKAAEPAAEATAPASATPASEAPEVKAEAAPTETPAPEQPAV
jgi:small subunit ribosomal protein S16